MRENNKMQRGAFFCFLCIILVSNAMESRSYRRDQKALRGEGV